MTQKQAALAAIEEKKDLICHVADRIWEYAELSLQEFRSAALYCEVLRQEGFAVEQGICGIETALPNMTHCPAFRRQAGAPCSRSLSPAARVTAAATIFSARAHSRRRWA